MDELASHRSSNSTLVVWHSPDKAEGLAYLKHVQAKANGKPLAFRKGGAKALGIRVPFEQNFASAALARQQLQNDVPISAQWIQVQDAKEAQRLLDLARVYDCKAKVGVVFQGPTDKLACKPMKFASVSSTGQKAVATWHVTALTASGSPEQQGTLKSTFKAPDRQLQILRVSIPKIFVEPKGWREVTQDPHSFLCKHVDVPWHSSQQRKLQELKQETVLQEYAKIEHSKYVEVLKKSGAAGIFLDELASYRSQDSARVVWHNPDNAEGLAYLKQVQVKAISQPLAFRKGGAKGLGIRQHDQSMPDSGSWRVRGVPVQWYEEDLKAAITGAGFTNVEIIIAKGTQENHSWCDCKRPSASASRSFWLKLACPRCT